jgi:hypothetical protein
MFPINPDRVLVYILKPVVTLTNLKALGLDMSNCPQGEVAQMIEVPVTPVTPVTSAALILLQDLIKQDAHALDDMSKQCLLRYVQKLINATNISLASHSLQRDQIQFMKRVNNEAKVRRSTKSLVLGKAKVISYEDLEEARAKRAVKEAAKAKGKGKRGRKRKSPVPELDASEVDVLEPKAKVARISGALEQEQVRAPVARMRRDGECRGVREALRRYRDLL